MSEKEKPQLTETDEAFVDAFQEFVAYVREELCPDFKLAVVAQHHELATILCTESQVKEFIATTMERMSADPVGNLFAVPESTYIH